MRKRHAIGLCRRAAHSSALATACVGAEQGEAKYEEDRDANYHTDDQSPRGRRAAVAAILSNVLAADTALVLVVRGAAKVNTAHGYRAG